MGPVELQALGLAGFEGARFYELGVHRLHVAGQCVCMYACMHACMYVRMYVCMYVFSLSFHKYMHIYICTHILFNCCERLPDGNFEIYVYAVRLHESVVLVICAHRFRGFFGSACKYAGHKNV